MGRISVWGVLAALVVLPAVQAEPIIAVDYVFIDDGSDPAYGDDFDDGVLGPEWEVVDGSPGPESGSALELNVNDFIVNTTPIAQGVDVSIGALLTEDLADDQFVFLVLFGEDRSDFFSVGLTGLAAFATDESLAPLATDGYVGPDVFFELSYDAATSVLTATVNDTTIFNADPGLAGGIAEVGIVVAVPEPATLPLIVFAGAWLMVPRRKLRC